MSSLTNTMFETTAIPILMPWECETFDLNSEANLKCILFKYSIYLSVFSILVDIVMPSRYLHHLGNHYLINLPLDIVYSNPIMEDCTERVRKAFENLPWFN